MDARADRWSVRFEDVSKRYRKGGANYPTIGSELRDFSRRLTARMRGARSAPLGTLALDDVSFEIEAGESFALIGANGAGKTTALRLLARISPPTSGRVRGRGRVGALMEVGSGIHTELTGRENIWLYGSILGISRAEIRRRFDEIVDFAQIPGAIDTPAKYYSSGMQLRLGFAIASHLEPDIFVVDEALSVGDASFQAKCVDRMSKLVRDGTTVLFVSHDLAAVESVCDRGILLDQGREVTQGPTKDVLARYLAWVEERRIDLADLTKNTGVVRIIQATCHGLDGGERYQFTPDEGLELRLKFETTGEVEGPNVSVGITDGRPGTLIECSMVEDGRAPTRVGGSWECRLRIDALPLRPRLYQVWTEVHEAGARGLLMDWLEVAAFRIDAPIGEGPRGVSTAALGGPISVPYTWDVRT
jgi:ABC-type polysaccharide/polyol phosphate transport system ATPase subunit